MINDMQKNLTILSDKVKEKYGIINGDITFQCPVKSFDMCSGTGNRQCLYNFPKMNACSAYSFYSLTSGIKKPNPVLVPQLS